MTSNSGLLTLAALVAAWLLSRNGATRPTAPAVPQDTQTLSGGDLALRLVKVSGGPNPSPRRGVSMGANAQLIEGASYRLEATLTNTSTRAGLPVPITVSLTLKVTAGTATLLDQSSSVALGAGEARTLGSEMFTVPAPLAAAVTGNVRGTVTDGAGKLLSEVAVAVDLVQAAVIPAVGISIRPPGSAAPTALSIPAPIVPPQIPFVAERIAAAVQDVFTAPSSVSGLDASGNIVDFQRVTDAVATARAQAGDAFVTPVNAPEIKAALEAVISDPTIHDMPVLVGSPQLATPPEAATTGVILPGSPERGTDNTNIIFPASGGWPDVTQFPDGTQISLTAAGYVATLPVGATLGQSMLQLYAGRR